MIQKIKMDECMSGLLFVSHETPDGRTGTLKRALINAHTLKRNRKLRNQHKVQAKAEPPSHLHVAHEKLPNQQGKQASTYDQHCTRPDGANTCGKVTDDASLQVGSLKTLHPSPVAAMPTGPIILGQDGEDIHNICQWYFLNQLHETHAHYFRHVHDHWTNGLWEMARVNQPMFAAIGAFAFHKEIALSRTSFSVRSSSAYIKQKGRMMYHISKDLSGPRATPDPLTLVAVAVLAYMDVRDSRFEDAKIHLRAVRKLVDMARLPICAWLYCVWIDLRYALFTAQMPILPHYIPCSLEIPPHHLCDKAQTVQRASRNASHCPQTSFFDHQVAFDLFNKVHALCLYSDRLEDSESPPFGQIYDLEYSLRIIQSQAFQEESLCRTVAGVELTIWAAQLHVWMACRFWTPQRRESHLALVSRARIVLHALHDAVGTWPDFASAEHLLWVLFTMITTSWTYGFPQETRMLDHLHTILVNMGISTRRGFTEKLAQWPWLSDWHPAQVAHIWVMLTDRFNDLKVEPSDACDASVPRSGKESQQRLFLGGLEYFNSL